MPSSSLSEPAHVVADEVAWLQGAFISSLLCGIQIMLSIISFLAVLKQNIRRRLRTALLVYILVLCMVMTAGQEVSLVFIQLGFIQNRNYPGGPNAFLSYQYNTPVYTASTALFVIANWMTESLMVWRCRVICTTGDGHIWIGIVLPPLILAGELAVGIQFLYLMLRGEYMIRYALAYTCLSLLLQFSVTVIIVGRLLIHRRRVVKHFGPGHGSHYASVAAVLIESASLYTAFLILLIIFFTVGTATSNILQQTAAQVQCISSLLIIYRIAQGKGWSEEVAISSEDWRGSMVAPEVNLESVTVEAGVRESPAEAAQGQHDAA